MSFTVLPSLTGPERTRIAYGMGQQLAYLLFKLFQTC